MPVLLDEITDDDYCEECGELNPCGCDAAFFQADEEATLDQDIHDPE